MYVYKDVQGKYKKYEIPIAGKYNKSLTLMITIDQYMCSYLPIHIIFETLEAVTVLKIWQVIPSEPSELPSLRRVAP